MEGGGLHSTCTFKNTEMKVNLKFIKEKTNLPTDHFTVVADLPDL